jgi:hypothetical protein
MSMLEIRFASTPAGCIPWVTRYHLYVDTGEWLKSTLSL